MEHLIDFFLELLNETEVPQKTAILSLFNQYRKKLSSTHVSNLEGLKQCENFDEVLFLDFPEDALLELPYELLQCKNLKSLDLSGTLLTSIEGISIFKDLEFLFLDECEHIKEIPSEIGKLKNLKGIVITGTGIESLPKEFFSLKDLVFCDLNENELTNEILFDLEKLECLVELDLNSNEMLNESGSILAFRNLKKVNLRNNNFEIIPIDFNNCPKLEDLDISYNPIQNLPPSLSNLRSLKELEMSECLIDSVPDLSKLEGCYRLLIGHYDMKAIPLEIFDLPNLVTLEIENSGIKYIPEEIGNLSRLENLNIMDCDVETLPSSIGRLKNLRRLELRDNKINHLPSELGKLQSLRELSLSNWKDGGNKLEELPSWIGNLKSLSQLDIDNIWLERLPPEIGELTNLSRLDLSSNPLSSLPHEFANLRKLKSLNLFDCPLDGMPEIKDMGIDELFEHLNKLRGVGRYSFVWELPESLQTAFQQYLNFFTDYIKKLKGVEINLKVVKTTNGLKLETEANSNLTIENIGANLNEYIGYINENVEFKKVSEEENPNLGLLRIQMETQINHFKQQIRQAEFENKYLRESFDKLLEAQVNFSHSFSHQKLLLPTTNIGKLSNGEFEKIRNLIVKNNFDKALNDLSMMVKEQYPSRLNEILVLHSRMNRLNIEGRIGSISFGEKQTAINKIVSSILEFLNSL